MSQARCTECGEWLTDGVRLIHACEKLTTEDIEHILDLAIASRRGDLRARCNRMSNLDPASRAAKAEINRMIKETYAAQERLMEALRKSDVQGEPT